jgi:hypothetical protein
MALLLASDARVAARLALSAGLAALELVGRGRLVWLGLCGAKEDEHPRGDKDRGEDVAH